MLNLQPLEDFHRTLPSIKMTTGDSRSHEEGDGEICIPDQCKIMTSQSYQMN
jgi:hypothetical protein